MPSAEARASVTDPDHGVATLITLRLSHYCEKARWGLDRLGFPYREEPHAPLLHRTFTRRHKGSSVPLLVHGSRSFVDSADILVYVDEACGGGRLYPRDHAGRQEVRDLEGRFDRELGPHVRRWAYAHLLDERKLLVEVWSDGVPRVEAFLLPIVMPFARRLIRRGYAISSDGAARSLQRVNDLFQFVEIRLRDGRSYLVGDRFTAADLTFASLAAPVLLPTECRAAMPSLERVPPGMREQVSRFRDTAAGQFAAGLYRRERDVVMTAAD